MFMMSLIINETLSDHIGDIGNVCLMKNCRLLMVHHGSTRNSTEVILSVTKMSLHVRPSTISKKKSVPSTKILKKNGLLCKNGVYIIDKLHLAYWLACMLSEFAKIFDCIEHNVYWI